MKTTYKNLFQLINDQISKRLKFSTTSPYKNQLDRVSISPVTDTGRYSASTGEIITAIQTLLSETLPPSIEEGLEVTATTPISSKVNISAGKGTAGGQLFELEEDITNLIIPLDNSTQLFYIVLTKTGLNIEKTFKKTNLTLAKIVIPKPGTTTYIQDNKDNSWNAYIVNMKEYKLYGYKDKFEEDTIELLRNNISPILADNLIGNIRLSENLKILNTQGTLELNSDSLKLLDVNENILAKFNQRGVFLYDTTGKELAKFTGTEGRIGNIRLLPNSIQSGNFVSGALGSGFQITDVGDIEANSVLIRGTLSSVSFQKDTISAIGGSLLVMDSDVLDEDMTALDASTLIIKGNTTFSIGDILRIKDGIGDEWLEVTNIASAPTYIVTRDKKSSYTSNNNPAWKKGTCVVNYQQNGDGLIYLTASETNSPYIDILTHSGSPWSSTTTKVRLGDLAGISDGEFSSITGYGLYCDNVYLKGELVASTIIGGTIQTALSGARISLTEDGLVAYDDSENEIFRITISDANPSIANIGDIIIGDYNNDKGIKWDNSTETFNVKGAITATSGVFTGSVTVGSAGKVVIDGANEVIKVYDASNNLVIELGKLTS